jgi:hypothetical protein
MRSNRAERPKIPEWELEEMIRDVIEQRCGVTSPTERWHGSISA